MTPVYLNIIQIMLGTISAMLGFYYFLTEDKSDSNRIYLLLMGIQVAMITIAYGLLGFTTNENMLLLLRRIGLIGIVFYLITLIIMLVFDIVDNTNLQLILSVIYIIIGAADVTTFGRRGVDKFLRYTNYTTYIRVNTKANLIHYCFVAVYGISLFVIAIIWYRKRQYKRDKMFAAISVVAHLLIVAATIPDLLFKKNSVALIDSNPIFIIAIAYVIAYFFYWYACYRYNIFAVNETSISTYLFDSVNAGVLVFYPNGEMALANKQAKEMLGLTETTRHRLDDIFQIRRAEARNFGNRAVQEKEFVCKWKTRKNDISCAVNTSVEFDKYGEPVCIFLVITDLTHEEKLLEDANAANVAKNNFLASMSHEIRTPINAILGMNEMILRGADKYEVEKYSEEIADAGEKLLAIINEILDIATGTDPKDIDFKEVLSRPKVVRKPYHVSFVAPEARILAIDDVEVNLRIIQHLLEQTKIQIDTALSGEEGLEMLKVQKYDLILLDHMMPDMDGIECLNHIRIDRKLQLNQGTPVLMVTANAAFGAGDYYIDQGFSEYISKPVRGPELEAKLIKYLPKDKIGEPEPVEEISEENAEGMEELSDFLRAASEFLDVKSALEYSAGDEDFYKEMIVSFINEAKDQVIQELFEKEDWKNYQIQMHSIKSLSLMFGANMLSERAKELELSLKLDNDVDFVKEKHGEFLEYLKEMIGKMKSIL